MAMGQVLKFAGVGLDKYDAVTKELGIDGDQGWPDGLVAHAVGATDDGFCVVELWDSREVWGAFFEGKLMPAFQKVGGIPQPDVTQFEVHNRHP